MIKYQILIPAYNAASSIGELLTQLGQIDPQPHRIIVVDDGSQDETSEIAAEFGIKLLKLGKNSGKGYALQCGFREALRVPGAPYIVCMDADLQHLPESVIQFLDCARDTKSKFIIGNRDKSIKNMPLHRVLSNRLTSLILSIFTGQKISDSQCGFRMIHRSVLKKISLEEKGFQLESEMILRAAELGEKIAFVPVPTIYAGEGSNIANIYDTARFIRLILGEIRHRFICILRDKTRKWWPLFRRKEYPT